MLVAVLVVGGAIALVPATTHAQQAIITVSDIQYAATVKLGSSGQAALIWQRFLNGYSTTAQLVEDGKFGPLSTAQAKAWQSSRGLVADGVMGPMSRAAAMAQIGSNTPASSFPVGCTSNTGYSATTGLPCAGATYPAGCASGTGYSSTTGLPCTGTYTYPAGCSSATGYSSTTGLPCTGTVVITYPAGCVAGSLYSSTTGLSCTGTVVSSSGEGALTVSLESSPSNNTAIPYSTTAGVMAVKIKATGSDMSINRVDFNFNKRAWLYAEKAGLYDGTTLISEKVLTSSSFDEITVGSNYRLRFDGLNYVIAKDATKYLTLKLTAPSIIADPATLVTVTFATDSIRATDSTGLITYDGVAGTKTFKISTATAGVLTVSLDTTSPKASTMIVSATDTTLDHILNVASFKATNEAINVSALRYTLTSTARNVDLIVSALKLYRDGVFVATAGTPLDADGTACSATTCYATFSDLDETIAKDATVKYTVKADIFKADASAVYYTAGETILATLATATADVTAEDADYTTLVQTTTQTGVSTGTKQHLFVKAPIVTLVSAPTPTVTTSGIAATQTGTFNITFTVKAQGSDIYVDNTLGLLADGSTVTQMSYYYTTAPSSYSPTLSSTATLAAPGYIVVDGTTETFTLTVAMVGGNAFNALSLTGVGFSIATQAQGDLVLNWGLVDFKTPSVYLAT